MTERLKQTPRTKLKRARKRGVFETDTIYRILDSTSLCHVGYVDEGQPFVTPTIHWREGDHVYFHGSRASRALQAAEDASICLTVSHLDGMVLARSGFHHSANYRSVMVLGTPVMIEGKEAKTEHLRTFMEQLYPGRWETLRPMTRKELNATTILSLPITEASAKVRDGDPIDDEADYGMPIWSGVIPFTTRVGKPEPDERLLPGVKVPGHVRNFRLDRNDS